MRRLVLLPELCPQLMSPVFLKLVIALKNYPRILHCGISFAGQHETVLARLRSEGLEIHQGGDAPIDSDSFLIYYGSAGSGGIFDLAAQAGAKLVIFVENTDGPVSPPEAREFIFYAHEAQMFQNVAEGEYFLDAQRTPLSVRCPKGGEGAVGGLFLVDEYFERRHEKKALRACLAEELGLDPESGRPLLFHPASARHPAPERDLALGKLGAGVDVVVGEDRGEGGPPMFRATGPHIYTCADKSLFGLAAYAADAVLPAAIEPRDLTFAVMAGLRTIPVYTERLYLTPEAAARGQDSSFTLSLRPDEHTASYDIISTLPPVSLLATDVILSLLHDPQYWVKYEQCLPVLQKNAFGRYLMGDKAFLRSAQFIFRLLKTGTLAPPLPERVSAPAPIGLQKVSVLL